MKYAAFFLLLSCSFFLIVATGADDKPKDVAPAVRTVAPSPDSLAQWAESQKRVDDAMRVLESTPAYKDVIIARQGQQTVLVAIMAENGLKPSEGCKPIVKDGALLSFECPEKGSEKKK